MSQNYKTAQSNTINEQINVSAIKYTNFLIVNDNIISGSAKSHERCLIDCDYQRAPCPQNVLTRWVNEQFGVQASMTACGCIFIVYSWFNIQRGKKHIEIEKLHFYIHRHTKELMIIIDYQYFRYISVCTVVHGATKVWCVALYFKSHTAMQ